MHRVHPVFVHMCEQRRIRGARESLLYRSTAKSALRSTQHALQARTAVLRHPERPVPFAEWRVPVGALFFATHPTQLHVECAAMDADDTIEDYPRRRPRIPFTPSEAWIDTLGVSLIEP
jgi:hypothetical protein